MSTKPRYRRCFLLILRSDCEAQLVAGRWRTPCLHCRSTLLLHEDGNAIGDVSLEHIIPQSWFGKRAALELCARVEDANDLRNLALACRRCNVDKGKGPDARGPSDARALAAVTRLFERRAERLRLHALDTSDGAADPS